MKRAATVVTHHTAPELTYCYGQDAITLMYGWFVFEDNENGRCATSPLFDQWQELLTHVWQEGYTASRSNGRTFVRRESVDAS